VRIAGEAEAPDEALVPEQTMDFIKEHEVALVGHQKHDALLLDLITKPIKFTVTETVGEGEFKGMFDVDILSQETPSTGILSQETPSTGIF